MIQWLINLFLKEQHIFSFLMFSMAQERLAMEIVAKEHNMNDILQMF